ncbi:DNA-directed RNA polymerase subunit D [Entamoeba marina]
MDFITDTITKRNPSIQLITRNGDFLSFEISDTDTSMVNALRRIIIADVPTLAIHLVTIEYNSSFMCDEYLAHRLGLIPLDSMNVYDFENDEEVNFRLEVAHEKGSDEDYLDVTSNDLQLLNYGKYSNPVTGTNPILITRLGRNQHIKLEAIAKRGTGRFHAKWNPTSQCVFQTLADIAVNDHEMNTLDEYSRREFCDKCPQNGKVTVEAPERCIFCNECLVYSRDVNKRNLCKVVPLTDKFIFKVEGTGVHQTQKIVKYGLDELRKKLVFLRSELGKIN